jgi:hypothetical protein
MQEIFILIPCIIDYVEINQLYNFSAFSWLISTINFILVIGKSVLQIALSLYCTFVISLIPASHL